MARFATGPRGGLKPAGEGVPEADATPYGWYVLGLLTLVTAISFMDRYALSILLPQIQKDLVLSDKQVGLLVGFAFFLTYAIVGIPLARLADRRSRRVIVSVCLVVWSAMCAVSGSVSNFSQLLAARLGLGVGEAGCNPAAQSLLVDYFPPRQRATCFSLYALGQTTGVMLGISIAGMLVELVGWRWTFVLLGIPGLITAAIVMLTVREPRRIKATAERSVPFVQTVRALLIIPSYPRLVAFLVLNSFVQSGLQNWYPMLLLRVHGLPIGEVGVRLGTAFGFGALAGLLLSGVIAGRLQARGMATMLGLGTIAVAASGVTIAISLFAATPDTAYLFIFVSFILLSFPLGSVIAALMSVTPAHARATGVALSTFCQSVLGYGLGPFAVGALSDHLAGDLKLEALRYAMLLPTLFVPILAFALFFVRPHIDQDIAKGSA